LLFFIHQLAQSFRPFVYRLCQIRGFREFLLKVEHGNIPAINGTEFLWPPKLSEQKSKNVFGRQQTVCNNKHFQCHVYKENTLPKDFAHFKDSVKPGHNELFEIELRGNAQIELLLSGPLMQMSDERGGAGSTHCVAKNWCLYLYTVKYLL
jgi:hypothetical protein